MSRNLASTVCRICNDERIVLDEKPRPVRADEVSNPDLYVGYLTVAYAHCVGCDAKYLAWVSHDFPSRSGSFGRWKREPDNDFGPPFVDLSFRSSFNDEPGADDLPTPEKLKELHRRQHLAAASRLYEQAGELTREAEESERLAEAGTSHWESYRRLS